MFRFEDHMPNYWLNESRDFQLLTRIDDILFMGLRADIATIQNLNDSKKCKNTFLNLLAKKVGFFTDKHIEENVLRNIIGAFKIAVKHKGTKLGVEYAVRAILKAENAHGVPVVKIDNTDTFTIEIYTPVEIKNKEALNEFLKYIIPAGFLVNIYSYGDVTSAFTELNNIDRILAASMNIATMASLRPYSTKDKDGALIHDIPTSDEDRMFESKKIDSEELNIKDPLTYLRLTYAGSTNVGIIASIDNVKNLLTEKAKAYKSNNDLDHGINIGEN